MFLKLVYTGFIRGLLATFVGVGVAAFYPAPKMPANPLVIQPYPVLTPQEATVSANYIVSQQQYQKSFQDYQTNLQAYNKNVSAIITVFAILILVVSLTYFKKLEVMADGLLLGEVLTQLYSIFRGFNAGDEKFRFLVVTGGLIRALALGYLKFLKPQTK